MTIAEGFVYGVVQGLTEFLPVSSSAHLTLLPWLLSWEDPGLAFDVALHVGTLLAVLWYFAADWWRLIRGMLLSLRRGRLVENADAAVFWKVALASIPAVIVGLALEHQAETVFREPLLIAAALALLGVVLYWSDRRPQTRSGLEALTWTQVMLVGLAQSAAIVPGVSRSGVTITAARLLAVDRETSARFSFLLATPIIAGAALLKVSALLHALGDAAGWTAILTSAAAGFLAIAVLLRYVRTRSYVPFVVYRLVVAAFVAVVALGS